MARLSLDDYGEHEPGSPVEVEIDDPARLAGVPDAFQRLWTPHRMVYIASGGQPESHHNHHAVAERAKGLYADDKMMQLHNSSDNPVIQKLYDGPLTPEKAHHLLHTRYENRNRISQEDIILTSPAGEKRVALKICFGTSCFLRGAQDLYKKLMEHIREKGLENEVEFTASFCGKSCKKGPVLEINGAVIDHCTFDKAVAGLADALR